MSFSLHNDEGMWLVNQLPIGRLRERYGCEPTSTWIEKIQKASVRLNNGGSGSFVSPHGLIVTNHHMARDVIHALSSSGKNYMHDGFSAKSQKDELRAPDLEINVLMEIEDVTERVRTAVKPQMAPSESFAAKRAEIAKIEKESYEKTGLRSNVVTLYQGAIFHLYRYKQYTDVRLVFAPEQSIAFFGDDPDNYEYPRYCLDVAFFRAYEDGEPLHTPHFFEWCTRVPEENELVFITGHPGRTDRLSTLYELMYLRDSALPRTINLLRRREITLQQFSKRSGEHRRKAESELFSIENTRKVRMGQLRALQNPLLISQKNNREREFRGMLEKNLSMQTEYGDAWDSLKTAAERLREISDMYDLLEGGMAFPTKLFTIARILVRLVIENQKPNGERLPEYRDSNRQSLEHQLFSSVPIYGDFETHKLADGLSLFAETFGYTHPIVQEVLEGKSPHDRAKELVEGTRMHEIEERKRLAAGEQITIEASQDSFITLARRVDPHARAVRKIYDEEVQEVRERAYAKIANAQFELYGMNVYPDATFTLRIAFGQIKGYEEEGKWVSPCTTIGETFLHAEKHENQEPWKLPSSWDTQKAQLSKSSIPLNFVSTLDTVGGNSGSPVVNRKGEIIGLHFDGNIHKLAHAYLYSDEHARSVAVHCAGILEALEKVYGADSLLRELI